MFPELRRLTPTLLLFAAGCMASDVPTDPPSADGGVPTPGRDAGPTPSDGGTEPPPTAIAKSEKANLRFKRTTRIRNDFAQALGLPVDAVCTELGQYSCTDFVHNVSLGGVEPYVLGLNEPIDDTAITTPIAVERVALYACGRRVDDDLAGPGSAVIYKGLEIAEGGGLADVDAEAVAAAVDLLYKRALLRPATAAEVAHHRQLYRDIAADGEPDAARDWAVLSCMSVLTSMESLFY